MVSKPEDYKWCSYGEAMQSKGGETARVGICRIISGSDDFDQKRETEEQAILPWGDGSAERYRMILYADGEEVFAEDIHSGELPENRQSKRVRKGFQSKEVERVLGCDGKLSLGEVVRCKVRYFCDGMTVGNKDYVEKVFKGVRKRFGEKRKSGARSMRGIGWREKKTRLYSMRELVKDRLG